MLAQQQKLLSSVRSQLPAPLADHCLHARIRGGELILHVDSPAWHSRLRFQAPDLLSAMRRQYSGLRKLTLRILQPPPHPAPPPATPPASAIRHILPDQLVDEELRKLLRR